jgi:hypothetical protein
LLCGDHSFKADGIPFALALLGDGENFHFS